MFLNCIDKVSPVLGDALKDLRVAHAQFMGDLQSCAFESAEASSVKTVDQTLISKLQRTIATLDEVCK